MNHIELFAGCGGLSLGLESEGFDLLLANELSPMAAETFAYNHLGIDLESEWNPETDNVYWLSSHFPRDEIHKRLKENPLESSGGGEDKFNDVQALDFNDDLRRSLLVGSILDLNQLIERSDALKSSLQSGLGSNGVDLVSGGPPCQSFSMAGLRNHSSERNSLPWAFAEFVRQVQPKIALLENVSGILRAFAIGGSKYYAWYEVAKAFAQEGYVPVCLHVNARYVGAAQNRPRFIMLAFRQDVAEKILSNSKSECLNLTLTESKAFFEKARREETLEYGHLKYNDIENGSDLFGDPIFNPLASHLNGKLVTVKEAIDDLNGFGSRKSKYVMEINKAYKGDKSNKRPANHELRKNNELVRARFRLYQVLNQIEPSSRKEIVTFLKTGDKTRVSQESLKDLSSNHWLLNAEGEKIRNLPWRSMLAELEPMKTKKQTQRALVANVPAPAALSIPDDGCHYDERSLRTLTVREMARIQSFPDWFEFRSKVTTGGQMRKFQVPQYTQVGNAVPPLLGKALGRVVKKLLQLADGD